MILFYHIMNIIEKLFCFFLCIILIEIFLSMLFKKISKKESKMQGVDIIKGLLERTFLLIAFINDLPTALVVFGALKLGTRLTHKEVGKTEEKNTEMIQQSKIESKNRAEDNYNNFFLIGNFISMITAIGYKLLWVHLMK